MSSVEHTLGEFVAAWHAGERPRLEDYVSRVPATEQDDLAQQIRMFMLDAPEPEYSEATWQEMTSDPIVLGASAASMEPEPWPSLLPRLREKAGLSVGQLVEKLGVRPDRRDKAAALYEEMERGDLEPERPSWNLLDKLAGVFGIDREALDWRGGGQALRRAMAPPAPSAAPAMFRSSEQIVEHDLDLLADGLTQEAEDWDEVDELFLGGR